MTDPRGLPYAIEIQDLTKRYGSFKALDNMTLRLEPNKIYGLLGRNGAGKTTLLNILTGRAFATSGSAQAFGKRAYENVDILKRICFIEEKGFYSNTIRISQALELASGLYPNWDRAYAERLVSLFEMDKRKKYKQLSRGMESSLGLLVGLASRAELTVFDEPSLGLDAVARERFYSEILREMESHPRTVIISTHLIDEVSQLFEDVVIIDKGRVLSFQPIGDLLATAVMLSGPAQDVSKAAANYRQIHEESLAGVSVATVLLEGKPRPTDMDFDNIRVSPVPLQKLFVYMTEGVA